MTGWWLTYPTPQNDGVSSSVVMMALPFFMESHKSHVPNFQTTMQF
jgi:hypothetical protein